MVTDEWCLLDFISAYEPFIFSLSYPDDEEGDKTALMGIWHPVRDNPSQGDIPGITKQISGRVWLYKQKMLYLNWIKSWNNFEKQELWCHDTLLPTQLI